MPDDGSTSEDLGGPVKLRLALLATAVAASALVASPATAIDPPANDNLADAIDISAAESPVSADNTLATTEPGEPAVNEDAAGIGHTVWYSWKAPSDGTFAFDTLGSAAGDTVLTAYYTAGQPASFDNFILLEYSDDLDNGGGNKLSGIVLNATSGTTYYLQVATWGYNAAATGQTTLNWSQVAGADLSVDVVPNTDPAQAPLLFLIVVTNDGTTSASTSVTVDTSSTPGAGIDPWTVQTIGSGESCPIGARPVHGQAVCTTPVLAANEQAFFAVYGGETVTGMYEVPVTLSADGVTSNNTSTFHDSYQATMPLQLTDYSATKAPGTQVTLHYRVDRTDGWALRQSSFAFKLPANARLEDDVEAWMFDAQNPGTTYPVACVSAGQQLVCPFTGHGSLEVAALVTPTSDAPMVTAYTLAASYVSPLSATDARVTATDFCDNVPTSAGQTITGGPGANILCGGGGNDTFTGGRGNDLIFGDAGNDTVSYAGSAAPMFVSLAQQSIDGWGSRSLDWHYGDGQDSFIGVENATGSSYADTLVGSSVVNKLNGGAGNDKLTGGAGKDVLNGGTGTDTCKESTDTKVSCEK